MVVLFRTLRRIMRETRWRAREQLHPIRSPFLFFLSLPPSLPPAHVSTAGLARHFLKRRRGCKEEGSAGCRKNPPECVNVERKNEAFFGTPLSHFVLCCVRLLQGRGAPELRGPGKGHVQPERPSASSRPHLTLLTLRPALPHLPPMCKQALSIHSALI